MKKATLIFSTILGLFILMSFVYQQDTTKEKSNSAIIYNTENKEWISSKTTLISAFNELAEDYHHVDKVSLSKIDDAEYTLTFWLKSGALAIAYTLENNDGNLVLIPSKEVYLHSCSGAPCSSVELKGYENDDSYPSCDCNDNSEEEKKANHTVVYRENKDFPQAEKIIATLK